MVIKAKYHTLCFRCGLAIRPGHWMDITRGGHWGGEVARHAACQTEEERLIAPFDFDKGCYVKGVPNDGR